MDFPPQTKVFKRSPSTAAPASQASSAHMDYIGSTTSSTSSGSPVAAERPPYTYAALITRVIKDSPEKRLTTEEIFKAICKLFPYYENKASAKSTIRSSLSTDKSFTKIPRQDGHQGTYWAVNPDYDCFKDGNYLCRKRKLKRYDRYGGPINEPSCYSATCSPDPDTCGFIAPMSHGVVSPMINFSRPPKKSSPQLNSTLCQPLSETAEPFPNTSAGVKPPPLLDFRCVSRESAFQPCSSGTNYGIQQLRGPGMSTEAQASHDTHSEQFSMVDFMKKFPNTTQQSFLETPNYRIYQPRGQDISPPNQYKLSASSGRSSTLVIPPESVMNDSRFYGNHERREQRAQIIPPRNQCLPSKSSGRSSSLVIPPDSTTATESVMNDSRIYANHDHQGQTV